MPVDMKTVVMNLAPQVVITKDNVSIKIETTVYYRTVDPYKLVYKLGNRLHEIKSFIGEISYSAMRTIVGEHIFQELLEDRAKIAENLEKYVKNQVATWGLYIENIFIKGIHNNNTRYNFGCIDQKEPSVGSHSKKTF